jgi:hypothetical protein
MNKEKKKYNLRVPEEQIPLEELTVKGKKI